MSRLVHGATTVVFRTTQDLEKDEFLLMLRMVCPELWKGNVLPYDFVYLQCPRVMIVNFISHDLCLNCFTSVHNQIRDSRGHIGKVQQARYQGLAENLGAFYAKAGRRGLESATAPTVFQGWRQIPLRLAVQSFVPPEMLERLRVDVRRAKDSRQAAAAQRPSPPATGASQSRPGRQQSSAAQSAPIAVAAPTIPSPSPAAQWQARRPVVDGTQVGASATGDAPGMWTAGDERQQPPLRPGPPRWQFHLGEGPGLPQPCGYSQASASSHMAPVATQPGIPLSISGMVVTERNGVLFFDL